MSTTIARTVLMLGTSIATFAAVPSWAQADPVESEEEAVVGDIIVTAQRRAESIQDVPVAITAADANGLAAARVENIASIKALTPSINFNSTNNAASSANLQIRGIGTTGNSRSFEGAVGIFVDGVYRTRAGQALQNFLDIDSLQILRGPQGTLFGKNTSAGALLIGSTAPDPTRFSGNVEASFANLETYSIKGALNLPLADSLAVRVAGLVSDRGGWVVDPNDGDRYNSRKPRAIKAQVFFEPSPDFTARLIVDYAKETGNCCFGSVDDVDGPTQPLINALTRANGLALPSSDFGDYQQTLNYDTSQTVIDKGVVLQLDWNVGPGKLHSVTGSRKWTIDQRDADADFSGADLLRLNESFRSKFFSQELTYTGTIDENGLFRSADYVFGAYYSDEDVLAAREIYWGSQAQAYWNAVLASRGIPPGAASARPGLSSSERMPGNGRSTALFSQFNVRFTDSLTVIAGARYSWERKEGAFERVFYGPRPNEVLRLLGSQPGPEYSDTQKSRAFSGTFGLQYRFSRDVMSYLTYSRGFKGGGVNLDSNAAGGRANNPAEVPGATPLDPSFKPEFVNGYEFGLKADYFGGKARTNIALFYNDLKDLQVAQFLGLQFVILNAPKAEVYGAEIENSFRLTPWLTMNAAATWLPKAAFGAAPQLGAILSGRRFSLTPKISGNLALSLDKPVSDDFAITGRAAFQYQSSYYTSTSSNLRQDGYGLLNLSLGIRLLDQSWRAELFCQNCTDKRYVAQNLSTPLQTGDSNAYVGAPRTYGLTVRARF